MLSGSLLFWSSSSSCSVVFNPFFSSSSLGLGPLGPPLGAAALGPLGPPLGPLGAPRGPFGAPLGLGAPLGATSASTPASNLAGFRFINLNFFAL